MDLKQDQTSTLIEKYMAQFQCIGSYGPFNKLPFWVCAMYFDYKVIQVTSVISDLSISQVTLRHVLHLIDVE